ncbi:MAG: hypothetical protein O7D30_03675, partial [Rickettsia endosymbiont of Ixodes persulcatus]|nr:hypothetical protein [Rickettsia endosymbiont of Ixodes persulcatus]
MTFGENQIFIDVQKNVLPDWDLLSKTVVYPNKTFDDEPLNYHSLIHSTLSGRSRSWAASAKMDPEPRISASVPHPQPLVSASDPQSAKSYSFLSESASLLRISADNPRICRALLMEGLKKKKTFRGTKRRFFFH